MPVALGYRLQVLANIAITSVPALFQGAPRLRRPEPTPSSELGTKAARETQTGIPRKVVYFPSCVTRMMGPARGDPQQRAVHDVFLELAQKAGYEVVIPQVRGIRVGPDLAGQSTTDGLWLLYHVLVSVCLPK